MTTGPGPRWVSKRWVILAGAIALVLVIAGTVFGLTRLVQPAAQPVATPTPTVTATPTPTPTETPTVPESSPTPTPTPSKEQTPYCKAFTRITTGGIAAEGEDGSVDFPALSAEFGTLIKRYSAAGALAPDSLKADYAKVLAYLRQGKEAVDAKDLDGLKVMVKNLSSLNATMSNIQAESTALCG